MKKLFTLSLLALFTTQISFAQDPGFYPPEGSTFSSDSSEITLPDAMIDVFYNETISFFASDSITIDIAGESFALPFLSAVITSVSTPPGMEYSCNIENCAFTSNAWGEVTLTGTPETAGLYSLDLTAVVTINAAPLGLPIDVIFPIPYDGSSELLNLALGGDYSAINSFVPSFFLNVNPFIGVEEVDVLSNLVVAPNPATTHANFSFYNADAQDLSLQVFDLLGNVVYSEYVEGHNASEQTITLNTSLFNNGVYFYTLTSLNTKLVGRLLINK